MATIIDTDGKGKTMVAKASPTQPKTAVKDTKEAVSISEDISLFDLCDLIIASATTAKERDENVVQIARQGRLVAIIIDKEAIS